MGKIMAMSFGFAVFCLVWLVGLFYGLNKSTPVAWFFFITWWIVALAGLAYVVIKRPGDDYVYQKEKKKQRRQYELGRTYGHMQREIEDDER